MATTQYYTATTLDGFLADEDNSLDWLFAVERGDGADEFTQFMGGVSAMAMGATTYEWVLAQERPHEDPERWRRYYGDRPCWVFTHRDLPQVPGVPISFVQGDVGPVYEQMAQAAGDAAIWLVGGGELVGQFADRGLLDEILVSIAPVTLGRGAPLLPRRILSTELELVRVGQQGQFAQLAYRVRHGR